MNLSRRDKAPTGEATVEAVNGEAVVVYDRRAAGFVAQLASFVCRCVAVVDKMPMAALSPRSRRNGDAVVVAKPPWS